MIDVSMMTMNCASAMTARADQRRGCADCIRALPFRAAGAALRVEVGAEAVRRSGERQAAAHRPQPAAPIAAAQAR